LGTVIRPVVRMITVAPEGGKVRFAMEVEQTVLMVLDELMLGACGARKV
jgi:hypothetical protein